MFTADSRTGVSLGHNLTPLLLQCMAAVGVVDRSPCAHVCVGFFSISVNQEPTEHLQHVRRGGARYLYPHPFHYIEEMRCIWSFF